MAKRKAQKRKKASTSAPGRTKKQASGKRPIKKSRPSRRSTTLRTAAARPKGPQAAAKKAGGSKPARLERVRRTLEETVQTPPSSLDMNRRGTAARTGRAEVAQSLKQHKGMAQTITGGDMDVDVEDAYFTGDEAPGGDNPTPDQDVVDDIGKALGVEYQDNEELKAADKVTERDRKRWELDPASSEDYKERK
jgi:uncharacterized protein DUF6335